MVHRPLGKRHSFHDKLGGAVRYDGLDLRRKLRWEAIGVWDFLGSLRLSAGRRLTLRWHNNGVFEGISAMYWAKLRV